MNVLVIRLGVMLAGCLPFRIEQLFEVGVSYAVIERVSYTALLSKLEYILDSMNECPTLAAICLKL